MITNEMKAKCIALYIGCEAQRFYRHTGVDTGDSIEVDAENLSAIIGGTGSYTYKLILKPLSEITDSDAIEVARLLDPWLVEQMEYELTRERISDKGHIVTIEGVQDKSRKVRIFLPMGHVFCSDNENTANPAAIDFLRSKGYALPYMGIDLFESGIAIPNNK